MKRKRFYIAISIILSVFISACSLKKNTPQTRAFQALNTRYNVYFNGKTSYDEGLKNILKANKEDYSNIIPMYPISKHDNAKAATSNMDRVIEKCRKSIKLHSIKQKPEKNLRKWNDPEYRLWYNQEEFNPALKEAWMLLAKAEFHKSDFIGSVGTFTYITRHYPEDKDMVARCKLWIVRAYGEMGWIYEAEEVLSKIRQDDLKSSSIGLFTSVNADLLLKKHQYKEAIPFLELALKKERNKDLKQRFTYLLAQLYMKSGDKKNAFDAFSKVIKMNPPYEMEFNARIYRAELDNQNVDAVRKELTKMTKNANNKDYLDQINYALGMTYIQHNDTLKAIEYFNKSVEASTRNGFDKALTLITLGDLYYQKQNYIKSQPCYDEASKIITVDNDDYKRVSKLAETLGELVVQYETVQLQDSLQYLSTLTVDKQLEIINKVIEKLKADEKAAEEAQKAAAEKQTNDAMNGMPALGIGTAGEWYFYNANLIKSGESQFLKKWGNRKLEDNWRRTNKSAPLFAEDNTENKDDLEQASDTTAQKPDVTDNKNPEFYIKQIPKTPAQIAQSNVLIADALFNMGIIYKDKIEDFTQAVKTFEEFIQRFPNDTRIAQAYYECYMLGIKTNDSNLSELYKNKLIAEFPKSKYVEVISQPDYLERMERMYQEQDSLYTVTYEAYNRSDFSTVKKTVDFVKMNYPLSSLMPKFLFLNALTIGKTQNQTEFAKELNEIVAKYPESDVSAMSKDILALMMQGKESKKGTTTQGSLLALRDKETKTAEDSEIKKKKFTTDKESKHRLLLITSADKDGLNKLLYNIAAFNFTRFMIKDFDLAITKLDSTQTILSVTNFDSYDEVDWYINSINNDPAIASLLNEMKVQEVNISEENFGTMRALLGLDAYLEFAAHNLSQGKATKKHNETIAETMAMKKTIPETKAIAPANAQTPTSTKKTETKPTETAKTQEQNIAQNKPQSAEKETKAADNKPQQQAGVDDTPLFKNLYAYKPNDPHFVAITILSGNLDYEKVKAAFDTYNAQNYSMLNLKLNKETVDKQQVIIIGTFADANVAKSYLYRMVKENSLMNTLKGTDYRNLLGTQRNLNVMMQNNAMSVYFEFMREYYLK
ncbi:MAG: tetratricopeptide repeat protein [Paludibacter sp.]|nr:tetratricopeptide repeat protein [Paludibacter sp.]